jgi:hypothetical protein
MWTLVLLWVFGATATPQIIPGFDTELACGNAFNTLHDKVSWGSGSTLIGKCISLKEVPDKKG